MENYFPFIFSPLKVYTVTLLTCITYLCFHGLRGNRQKNQTLRLQVRVENFHFFHKTFSHFLSNISALLQLGFFFFFNFLMGRFQKLYIRSCSEKQENHPEILWLPLNRKVNFAERSCHATHHSQPVTELRISHKFSLVLSDISQPIQVIINNIRNFNPLISKFFIAVNSILPLTERGCKCLVLTGVLQGASWAQKGCLQWSITGLCKVLEGLRLYIFTVVYLCKYVSLGWCRLDM